MPDKYAKVSTDLLYRDLARLAEFYGFAKDRLDQNAMAHYQAESDEIMAVINERNKNAQ